MLGFLYVSLFLAAVTLGLKGLLRWVSKCRPCEGKGYLYVQGVKQTCEACNGTGVEPVDEKKSA